MSTNCRKEKGSMKASEFAKMRGIDPRTINKYLERHPELREDCTKEGNSLILGDYAERELSKVYPLPQPVIIGIPEEDYRKVVEEKAELLKKLAEAREKMLEMQETLFEQKEKYLEEKKQVELLEIKENQAEEKAKRLEEEVSQLKMELETEKQKTWFQKLIGK